MTATTDKAIPHPVFTALDTISPDQARVWSEAVRPHVGGIKIGLEFFTANGPAAVRELSDVGLPVFLDLKLHDIPNTVAGAVRAIAPLSPSLLTVHASGGPAMVKAAVDAARDAAQQVAGRPRTRIVAVTVLTSLDDRDLEAVGQRGPALDQVLRLADTALEAGADGVVASPRELAALRKRFGDEPLLVIPGIRPAWAAAGDQKRVTTPADAIAAGADILVIGRPITQADDPAAAARRIADELRAGGRS